MFGHAIVYYKNMPFRFAAEQAGHIHEDEMYMENCLQIKRVPNWIRSFVNISGDPQQVFR